MRIHTRARRLRLNDNIVGTVLPSDKLGDTVPRVETDEAVVAARGIDSFPPKRFRAQQPTLSKTDIRKPSVTHQSRIQQPRPGF